MKKHFIAALLVCCLTSFVPVAFAQSADECMAKVKELAPMLPKLIESAKSQVHTLMPDPAAYEKTLPALDKVIADKDQTNLKNYGGLCEAYFFSGDNANGQRIYDTFMKNEKDILGADNTYGAFVQGDIGILRYLNKDYPAAEQALAPAINQLESHMSPSVADNLIASYLCLSLIKDQSPDAAQKKEGAELAKKLVDLAIKQRQPQ